MPVPHPRPTLDAVAQHAGVSRATASRVVNGGTGVSGAAAERVRQAVQELGYVPNQAARSLATRRQDAVAVVIAEPESRVFADPFFARQVRGISKELAAAGSQLVLLLIEQAGDYDRVANYLAGNHVDGALIFSLHAEDPLPEIARRIGLPTVFGGRPGWPGALDDPAVRFVDVDNRGGAREAVTHLFSLGRRTIAHIAGPLDQVAALDRLAGYRDVLVGGDPALVEGGGFTAQGGAQAMARLLESASSIDGVFAASDLMATGALRVLRERGLRVPQDVAVVGFDDLEQLAEASDPPLTTVHQDVEKMGRLMARLLLHSDERDSLPPATSVIIPTRLVVRASA
jgi:DNA-binding LacI/PurR family transcriptional regulator